MKQKKLRPLILLGVVIALLCVLLALLTKKSSPASEVEPEAVVSLCGFSPTEVVSLTYTNNGTETVLTKNSDESWTLASDPELPIDAQLVEAIITELAGLAPLRELPDGEVSEMEMGFDAPTYEFTLATAESSWSVIVGGENAAVKALYAKDSNGTLCIVEKDAFFGLCPTAYGLYAPGTAIDFDADDVVDFTVLQGEKTLHFIKNEDIWQLADEPNVSIDQMAVTKMVRTACELETQWSITQPEESTAYGLDQPAVTVGGSTAGGEHFALYFGSLCPNDETRCYLSVEGTNAVHEVSAAHRNAFAVEREALRVETSADSENTEETTSELIAQYPVGGINEYADAK